MICKYDGATMKYMGIVDGCGDYGDQICDEWECPVCGEIEEHSFRRLTSWEHQAVDEIIEEEIDDDDTHEFPI